MAETPYESVKFRLRAEIADVEFHDIVQWSADWALNSIPSSTLMVGVGRELESQKAATIHTAVSKLKIKVRAKVYLRAIPHGRSANMPEVSWPADQERLVFEGYAVGSSWERSHGTACFVLHLTHWLDDLNCSSAISSTSHPHNPADFTFSAVFPSFSLDGADSGGELDSQGVAWIPMCDAQKNIDDTRLAADLWGQVLHPWFMTVAKTDRFDLYGSGNQNDAAIAALDRMKGGNCYVPLSMDLGGVNGEALGYSVRQALSRETFASWVNTTLWGKLVGEMAPAFFFAIVPRVSDALVVPFTGPLRDPAWRQIEDYQHNYMKIGSHIAQALKAVGIVYSAPMRTGADLDAGAHPTNYNSIGGWYEPPAPNAATVVDRGVLLIKEAPHWLADVIPEHEYSRESTGAEWVPTGSAFHPGAGAEKTNPAPLPAEAKISFDRSQLLDRYAQQWFALEMLKGRIGEMSGKLRFDIAPGSNVRIICGREQFVANDALAEPQWASVLKVSTVINAERSQAGTAFSLAHIRTDAENTEDKTSVTRPPLYTKAWAGCSLLD